MSCYLRHLKGIFERAGVQPANKEERKALDLAVRELVGAGAGQQCNETWKIVKGWLKESPGREDLLVSELARKLGKRQV
ncbi:MAG: hypothetical protein ACOY30_03545 [Bacillota bacterium]